MKIPFLDLKREYAIIKPEIDRALQNVLERQIFVLGEEVERFEKEFAQYLGVQYAVSVNSGTDALILSLRALGIGPGDEVITQPNSFIATALAVSEVGAKPVFVDVDSDTYQIDIERVKKNIGRRTKAILPVHLYGASCEIEKLVMLAKQYNLFLVEDAAQAHGSTYKNKKLGTFGDLAAFSFYPAKNLGAYGDGGAIVTNNKNLYKRLLLLRNYGQTKKYYHESMGINSRLDEMQAAVLRVKLAHLDAWNQKRRELAKLYSAILPRIKRQKIVKGGFSNYYVFVIEYGKRTALQRYLEKNGIGTLVHYPIPIHLQKCYQHLGYQKGDFPIAEKAAQRVLSLPLFPELKREEVEYVAKKIKKIILA